jgi:exopolysaccharide biosynthesis polyprenyl glycosylphosphotransferase
VFRRFSANFAVFSIFLDMILIDLGLWFSAAIRTRLNPLSFVADIPVEVSLPPILYSIFPILWILIFLLFSVYDGRKNLRIVDEFGSMTVGTLLAAVAMAGVLYFSFRDISRFLFVFFVIFSLFLMLIWRAVIRLIFRSNLIKAVQQRRFLILGAGVIGRKIQEQIIQKPYFGLSLQGFLDDDVEKREAHPDILGPLDEVRGQIEKLKIDDVIIALPLSAHERLNQMVAELHDMPVRVWVIPDYFALTLHRAAVDEFAGIPMLDLRAPALSEYQRMVKRAFDLFLSFLALPFVAPIMLLCSIAIKLDSKGPVFYRSKRVGENGRIFQMLKFRTMVEDADQKQNNVLKIDEKGHMFHKLRDDPRITKVGKYLRRWSLDEFPQIINVIKGEMSIVGPRPEMPWLVEKYELWQRKRFALPQGVTGWWQVHGRSDKPMHLNTQDDLYYVQHYSIWLDIQIIIMTIWVVLTGKGAF